MINHLKFKRKDTKLIFFSIAPPTPSTISRSWDLVISHGAYSAGKHPRNHVHCSWQINYTTNAVVNTFYFSLSRQQNPTLFRFVDIQEYFHLFRLITHAPVAISYKDWPKTLARLEPTADSAKHWKYLKVKWWYMYIEDSHFQIEPTPA